MSVPPAGEQDVPSGGDGQPGGRPEVYGVAPDRETRCAHYHGPLDRVAIRFWCCQRYYCCHACHQECEPHEAVPWPLEEFDQMAVLCGACGQELTVHDYLASGARCPRCGAGFNPRCATHYPLYFQVSGPGDAPPSPRPDRH